MWISELHVKNIQSYEKASLKLSKRINLIVGANNSGKSALLRSMLYAQKNDIVDNVKLARKMTGKSSISIVFEDSQNFFEPFEKHSSSNRYEFRTDFSQTDSTLGFRGMKENDELNFDSSYSYQGDFHRFPKREPHNAFYVFLAKRKTPYNTHSYDVNSVSEIAEDFRHIVQRIDKMNSNTLKGTFTKLCEEILGFTVSKIPNKESNSNQAIGGAWVGIDEYIPIEQLGEGVINIVALINYLLMAKNQIFLIEEIENDIHPKALKLLLALIVKASSKNQFIISTHSNIVVKYLAAEADSKIFNTTSQIVKTGDELAMPTSNVIEISNTAEERIRVLEDLGYDVFDFELWKGYLILEESSAELIIREVLIPEFCPALKAKIRTIETKGVSRTIDSFDSFLTLFVYVHTSSLYKERAWVLLDGDPEGKKIISQLKSKFKTWPEQHFQNLSQPQFENYYPSRFQDKAQLILSMDHGLAKMKSKGKLAEEIVEWARNDRETAIEELRKSFEPVIGILQEISKALA